METQHHSSAEHTNTHTRSDNWYSRVNGLFTVCKFLHFHPVHFMPNVAFKGAHTTCTKKMCSAWNVKQIKMILYYPNLNEKPLTMISCSIFRNLTVCCNKTDERNTEKNDANFPEGRQVAFFFDFRSNAFILLNISKRTHETQFSAELDTFTSMPSKNQPNIKLHHTKKTTFYQMPKWIERNHCAIDTIFLLLFL